MEITVIRSRRKTLALQVKDLQVIVRAPLFTGRREIEAFVEKNRVWIMKQLKKQEQARKTAESTVPLTEEEKKALIKKAHRIFPERCAYYAERIGVDYNRITIRGQKTRWGSCSAKGNLNFNWLLLLAPPEVLDSVVVHELCHRKEMNHSKRFYEEVYRVFPDYDKWNRWLKENGDRLQCYL